MSKNGDEHNQFLIYQDENEITKISVRLAEEELWVTQNQLAEIYDTTRQNITQHIDSIYKDGELRREATSKDFLLVRTEGQR
jgi:hypothetical protein